MPLMALLLDSDRKWTFSTRQPLCSQCETACCCSAEVLCFRVRVRQLKTESLHGRAPFQIVSALVKPVFAALVKPVLNWANVCSRT